MKLKILQICFVFLAVFSGQSFSQPNSYLSVELPKIIVSGIPAEIKILSSPEDTSFSAPITIGKQTYVAYIELGEATITHTFNGQELLQSEGLKISIPVKPIPLWFSIIPPLIAILMALFFKEVVSALFIGILTGTGIIYFYSSGSVFEGFTQGLLAIIDTYVLESLLDKDHISIIVFSMMIGAMVSVITKNGGMKGVVNKLTRFATTARSGQLITWVLGIAIFFDDYANTLVVGNTMRPITDRLKISRQKLAYIVDSTAAPVASIAFVTTWIGAELSYIQSGISTLGLGISAYTVFLNSLTYSFYPIFTLAFVFILIYRKVDFGPMLLAERKTRLQDITDIDTIPIKNEIQATDGVTPHWYNAIIPVGIVVFGTMAGLIYTGWDYEIAGDISLSFIKKVSLTIGNSDSYSALLWSSMLATLVAVLLSISQRLLNLQESVEGILDGFKTMLPAIVILVLAWSIALVTEHMHTADFISQLMVNTNLSPVFVPLITFILGALVAFSTGSSWGTMAILYPIILPASWLICGEFNFDHSQSLSIFYNVVASVLAGAVLGDHCSPISDTTILSSLASSCPHIEHVKTQMPYALLVGGVSAVFGVLPAAIGFPAWITFPFGIGVLWLLIKYLGKPSG
jgi:Na+/H+ antiporter NhaC